jgi:endonuclease/exonuclease/phosphatase family metal-dependent hydrolase
MSTTRAACSAFVLVLGGCAASPLAARAPAPGRDHYVVKSNNVECGKHTDATIIDAIGAGDPDIVFLQETTTQYEAVLRKRYSRRFPYQVYQHNAPNGGAAGLAVLSRFPVIDRGHHPAPHGWHPAWHVDVETPSGPIQILHVHLRAKLSGRGNDVLALLLVGDDHLKEIEHFTRWTVPDLPTLVIGDFNEEANGAAVRWLEARGYRNALPLFRPDEHTWRHPFLAWELRQTLDHILFDRAFEPLDARVIDAGRSDHLPVVAHLQVARDPRWPRETRKQERPRVPSRQSPGAFARVSQSQTRNRGGLDDLTCRREHVHEAQVGLNALSLVKAYTPPAWKPAKPCELLVGIELQRWPFA